MIRQVLLFLVILCFASNSFAQKYESLSQPSNDSSPSEVEPSQVTPIEEKNNETDNTEEVEDNSPFQHQGKSAIAPTESPSTTEITPTNTGTPTTTNTTETIATPPIAAEAAPEHKESNYRDTALLQGLNKITARTSQLEVTLGHAINFGNLNIILHACWKSPPDEEEESKALLEMWEEIPGEPRTKIFSGWMFASSPLISAPQHPVYDITLMECRGSIVEEHTNPTSETPNPQ